MSTPANLCPICDSVLPMATPRCGRCDWSRPWFLGKPDQAQQNACLATINAERGRWWFENPSDIARLTRGPDETASDFERRIVSLPALPAGTTTIDRNGAQTRDALPLRIQWAPWVKAYGPLPRHPRLGRDASALGLDGQTLPVTVEMEVNGDGIRVASWCLEFAGKTYRIEAGPTLASQWLISPQIRSSPSLLIAGTLGASCALAATLFVYAGAFALPLWSIGLVAAVPLMARLLLQRRIDRHRSRFGFDDALLPDDEARAWGGGIGAIIGGLVGFGSASAGTAASTLSDGIALGAMLGGSAGALAGGTLGSCRWRGAWSATAEMLFVGLIGGCLFGGALIGIVAALGPFLVTLMVDRPYALSGWLSLTVLGIFVGGIGGAPAAIRWSRKL
jgi:hypothetical protein